MSNKIDLADSKPKQKKSGFFLFSYSTSPLIIAPAKLRHRRHRLNECARGNLNYPYLSCLPCLP